MRWAHVVVVREGGEGWRTRKWFLHVSQILHVLKLIVFNPYTFWTESDLNVVDRTSIAVYQRCSCICIRECAQSKVFVWLKIAKRFNSDTENGCGHLAPAFGLGSRFLLESVS